jgi:hypothetical protein
MVQPVKEATSDGASAGTETVSGISISTSIRPFYKLSWTLRNVDILVSLRDIWIF